MSQTTTTTVPARQRKSPRMPASLRPLPLLGVVVVCGFLAAFLIVPLLLAAGGGFFDSGQLSLEWFRRALGSKVVQGQLVNSVLLACCTTLVCILIALPLAMLRARRRFAGQGPLGMLLLVPMILPPFVGALSIRQLFSQFGAFNMLLERIGVLDFSRSLPPDWLGGGFAGVVALQALHLFPILYLNASAALANVDPAYGQAARNLGAGGLRTFFRVTLPLIRPGLFAGGTIVFIWAMTDVGTPLIMGYHRLVPVTIFKELAKSEHTPAVFSLVFVMLSASVSLYVLGKFVFGRALAAQASKASIAEETRRLGPLATLGAWALFGGVILLALLPHVGVVLTAFSARWVNTVIPSEFTLSHLKFVLQRPATVNSIFNSLKYAAASTAIDVVLGMVAAWLIIRSRVVGRSLVDGMSMLPLAVPGLILAAGYVAMTSSSAWLTSLWPGNATLERVGEMLKSIGPQKNPVILLIIAYSVRRLPFMVRGVSAGLQQVSTTLEEAARNLGGSRFTAAARITIPLIAANLIAGAVLTFTFAMLEVSDSLILAQESRFYPITKEIYTQATSGNPDAANIAAALGVYGMFLLGGTMALASALLGKRLGAIFRA